MTPVKSRRVFWFVWACLAALMTLWSLATPISAAPDEPAHLVKAAAVVRGQWTGPASSEGNIVTVPLYIAWTHAVTCPAFNEDVPASCAPPMPGDPAEPTESRTTAGLYNPVYYLLVGWPSLLADDVWGIYAMRIVSGLISSVFVAFAAATVAFWSRRLLPWVAIVALSTPMLLFLGGVVNPNALETTTTLATVVAMVSLVRFPTLVPRIPTYALLVGSAALGVNTRGLAPLWFLVALGVPLLLLGGRDLRRLLQTRATIVAMASIGVATALAVAWTLGTASLTASVTDPDAQNLYPGTGQPALYGFLFVLERTFSFGSQIIGLFGWMDTPSPALTYFVWTLLIGGVTVAALAVARRRTLVALWTSLGAFVLLPALIQGAYVTGGGYIWQGRYAFPLLAIVLTIAALALVDHLRPAPRPARRLIVVGAIGVVAAHIYTFAFVLKRYASGDESTWLTFVREPEWSAPAGNLALIAIAALVLVASGVVGARGMLRAVAEQPRQLDGDADERPDGERDRDAGERFPG